VTPASTHAEIVRDALAAIMSDDLPRVAELLDPQVEWLWFEPGGTDCRGRDAVLAAFRERLDEDALGDVRELTPVGDDVLVSITPSAPAAVWGAQALWTRVSFAGARAVRLVSYDTRERALAAG
jgi:ketosteroid isomerase-like protein